MLTTGISASGALAWNKLLLLVNAGKASEPTAGNPRRSPGLVKPCRKRRPVLEAQFIGVADAGGIAQIELFDADAARGLHVGAAHNPRHVLVEPREQHQRASARRLDRRKRGDWHAVEQAAVE